MPPKVGQRLDVAAVTTGGAGSQIDPFEQFQPQGAGALDNEGKTGKKRRTKEEVSMFDISPGSQEASLHTKPLLDRGDQSASLTHKIKQPIAAAALDAGACLRWLLHDPPDLQKARAAATRVMTEAKRAADMIDCAFPLPDGNS